MLYHNVYSMGKLLQFFGSARGINKDASRIIYLKRIVIITLYVRNAALIFNGFYIPKVFPHRGLFICLQSLSRNPYF